MKRFLSLLLVLIATEEITAQNVGIGTTTPAASAMLEINSSNKGVLLPRVTDTSSVSSPAKGLIIYNNTNNKLWYYDGSRWQQAVANAGGMDSIWFKTKDTIVYTFRPYVGVNADYSLIEPQANLQVNGSLLIQGKLNYTLTEPTAGQVYIMNNTGGTQPIPSTDSVFRIYDPGGTGNYNNNMQGNMFASGTIYITGYKISSVAADFGMGTGDTLWISKTPYPACKNDYEYMFTNTLVNPTDFIVNSMYGHCYFIFRSNADGNNNKGFNFKVTRLYSDQPYKQMNTSGPALYFNSADGSFAAGNRAFAASGSVAIGGSARASNYGATAIGWTEATGYYSTSIGTGYYYPNVASGDRSVSIGTENNATSFYAIALGSANNATGGSSVAVGHGNETSGLNASAFGFSNVASGVRSTVVGFGNRAKAYSSMTIGCYNDTSSTVSATSWVATEPLLIVGNGSTSGSRSNAMVILKNGNVGIGTNSPFSKLQVDNGDAVIHAITIGRGGSSVISNTAIGWVVLSNNSTGHSNTAVGAIAMEGNTTGYYNTGIGYQSLLSNTTGTSNTAVGTSALRTNVAGNNAVAIGTNAMYYANNTPTPFSNHNIAVGYEALRGSTTPANNTGNNNTSIGFESMQVTADGNNNSALGYQAMVTNTSGDNNTAIGYVALVSNTSGHSNTSIGYGSINNNTTGNYNTALGRSAYFDLSALDNTTCIGANAGGIVDASNRIEIGNTSVTAIAGQVSFSTYSDGRIKDNIAADVPGLSFINRLRPVSYNLNIHRQNEMVYDKNRRDAEWASKYDIEKIRMTGFIAQEVEQAAREINFDFSGVQAPAKTSDLYSLRYSDFVMPLVKSVQELSKQNQELKDQNSELKARLEKLEAAILKK